MTGEEDWRQQFEAGIAAHAGGRLQEAVAHFALAARQQPDHPVMLYNLGIALEDAGRGDAALPVLAQAARLRPDHTPTLFRLGSLLAAGGQQGPAADLLARLVALQPGFPDAGFRLGNVLMALERYEPAIEAYRLALALEPGSAAILNNLGSALLAGGRVEGAIQWLCRAVRLTPSSPESHKNLGTALFLKGEFRQGGPHYDWRERQENWGWKRQFPGIPRWHGSSLAGKTILVHYEQGLGDTILFIRYLSLLKQDGARTLFECQPTLRDILAWVPDIDQLICHGDPLPPADFHVPLISLAGLCGTTPGTVPGGVAPYLHPPAPLVAAWGRWIGGGGFKIGVNWQASAAPRSIPLSAFAPIAAIDGVRLFSLQQDVGLDQLDALSGPMGITTFPDAERDRAFGSFVDSAAIIANLDLVISCDSAMIHLAGAMGQPAFLALPRMGDWRWMQHPHRTPWYDSVRLFRATAPQDWASAIAPMVPLIMARIGDGSLR